VTGLPHNHVRARARDVDKQKWRHLPSPASPLGSQTPLCRWLSEQENPRDGVVPKAAPTGSVCASVKLLPLNVGCDAPIMVDQGEIAVIPPL